MKKLPVDLGTPCYKFINSSIEEQLDKLCEEAQEAKEAWRKLEDECGSKVVDVQNGWQPYLLDFLIEVYDVQICLATLWEMYRRRAEYNYRLGDLQIAAQRKVLEKNIERGYYEEPKGGGRNG